VLRISGMPLIIEVIADRVSQRVGCQFAQHGPQLLPAGFADRCGPAFFEATYLPPSGGADLPAARPP
jgi:hypothetical protein